MAKSDRVEPAINSRNSQIWIARDSRSGHFVEVRSSRTSSFPKDAVGPDSRLPRRPGRFKGRLNVGPEFFEPLSEDDLADLNGA